MPSGERRKRRTADQARREILDAAQRRLVEGGPDAIRLQDIARDVGISHPAILHHFGSREGLLGALDERAIRALTNDVARVLSLDGEREVTGAQLIERVAEAMEEQGLARLIAWWSLRGPSQDGSLDPARLVVEAAELIRDRLLRSDVPGSSPPLDHLVFGVRLAVVAMFGDALIGDELTQRPAAEREAERHRFRAWLADLLLTGLTQRPASDPDGESG